MINWNNLTKTFGPGILFASTAIGVSHLVQSTRAGAQYGFALIGFVLLANILKYPFFEFGSRYANITGNSLLIGYKNKGIWVLFLYFIVTLLSMFSVVAAVSFVCSGLLIEISGIQHSINIVVLFLFTLCVGILISGKFSILDGLVKVVSVVLLISTLMAFMFTLFNGPEPQANSFVPPVIFNDKGVLFLIALMGWMPTAVDLSVWNSIWTVERIKQTGYKPTLKETLLDFNIGYVLTIVLSVCFITLGAFLMYGTGLELPNSSPEFANKLVSLYTQSLGNWSYWLIAISAFSVMFSTTIAVFDGYSRTIEQTFELLFDLNQSYKIYVTWLLILAIGGYVIIWQFMHNFKQLIDLATSISFLIAPFCAIANHILIFSDDIPVEQQPKRWLRLLSYIGIAFLSVFSIIFLFYI